jgi:hypothetical protein
MTVRSIGTLILRLCTSVESTLGEREGREFETFEAQINKVVHGC